MLRIVDRLNGKQIQKVTKPNGEVLRYQVTPEGAGDASQVVICSSLTEARKVLGRQQEA